MDFRKIEEKWKKRWEESKIFEAEPDKREKFFVNVAYPYINGYGHIGHLFTFLKGDIAARFKRMQGYNVLFPQGFHATGQPIVAAAKRIKEGEEKQIQILKDMGISEKEIKKFSEVNYWVKIFPEKWVEDLKNLGFSIDWRRSFITTGLNKPYDTFVKWQFNKLKEKGLIKKGSHPVVFCEKCGFPIGDHDRSEGEGVVPVEVTLIKFEIKGKKIPVMTYRPETVYGVTNLWVNPKGNYIELEVSKDNKKENWIVSKDMIKSLKNQNFVIKEIREISGEELIGKKVVNPITEKKVMIFPADFVDLNVGSGIVMSVPAHAPFDYIGIKELRKNKEIKKKYNLKEEDLNFDFISLIKLEGYGEFPAVEIVEKMNIKSQKEKDKLDKATEEIYKKEFHSGIVKIIEFEGKKVSEIKNDLIEKFVNLGIGLRYYILPEKVVCRCLTPAVIKIVKDQWFLNYSNQEWKKKTHKLANKMKFYPDAIRENIHCTIDWLNDWACTRDKKTSIGTTLPFDKTQVIESLSDSTIYMAYYTISNYLQEGKLKTDKDIKESLFEYVFLGNGNIEKVAKENNIGKEKLKEMREKFLYWYKNGFQIRNSGKDLIQNHLTFCLFAHTAIFPPENLPEGISVNGHVMLNGEKMSKSKGNVIFIKDAIKDYPCDVLRFLVAYGGNIGLDDANIELKENKSIESKLKNFYEFATSNYNKGLKEYRNIDKWFESVINRILEKVSEDYNKLETKSALQIGFFELQNHFKWYKRRSVNLNKDVLNRFIEIQTKILAPVCPFIAEEIWEKIWKKDFEQSSKQVFSERKSREFISLSEWPKPEPEKIDETAEKNEEIISNLLEDIKVVIDLSKIKPKKIKIVVPEKWKYKLFSNLDKKLKETRDFGELIKETMKFDESKKKPKEIQRLIKRILSGGINIFEPEEEKLLEENKDFFEKEFGCKVEISERGEKESWPGKFGILVE